MASILRRQLFRNFSRRCFSDTISVTFIDSVAGEIPVAAKIGETILEVAHNNEIDLEGACGGELACSTCHCILEDPWYEKVLSIVPKGEEEEDMLDLAWGLTDNSRLGCQIKMVAELEGIEITIPEES
mmetsp:Transcript_3933/g.5191  ORF Transcript_3933/g.5191 Transcript_3933/m.5191 type:complete len:128 (-) Transcript_3933:209-592(-)